MKYIFLLCLIGLALAAPFEEMDPDEEAAEEKCKAMHNIQGTDEQMAAMFENPNDDLKCFMDCVLTEMGLLENGEFSELMVALRYIPFTADNDIDQETVKVLGEFKACGGVTGGEGKCDLAFNFILCLAAAHSEVA